MIPAIKKVSIHSHRRSVRVRLTLHGLFNSKPGGASCLSVCPRKSPVSRRSRFITIHHCQLPRIPCNCFEGSVTEERRSHTLLFKKLVRKSQSYNGRRRTHPIPSIDVPSRVLPSIGIVPHSRKTSTCNPEHLLLLFFGELLFIFPR